MIDVIIPTKSNVDDLARLLANLVDDPAVRRIILVCDGPLAYRRWFVDAGLTVEVYQVPLASGLHGMWNLGLWKRRRSGLPVAIINDDITLSPRAMTAVCDLLDRRPDIGLVSPSPNRGMVDEFVGGTGFAGYCMVLAADLVDEWRFDERMKWWYGDADVMRWVSQTKGRAVGQTGVARALNNRSYTIQNDPPPNFHADIENDARVYHAKWND